MNPKTELKVSTRVWLMILAIALAGIAFWSIGASGIEVAAALTVYVVGSILVVMLRCARRAFCLSALVICAAFAATPFAVARADATIVISGSPLSVTTQPVTCTSATLSGTATTVSCTTSAWTFKDPTGTGAGSHLNISASDFTNAGGKTISVSGFRLSLANAAVVTVDGNTKPASSMTGATSLSTSAQTLISAATNTGMGTYTLTPSFTLDIPADTYAGTYTATVTVTAVAGP